MKTLIIVALCLIITGCDAIEEAHSRQREYKQCAKDNAEAILSDIRKIENTKGSTLSIREYRQVLGLIQSKHCGEVFQGPPKESE